MSSGPHGPIFYTVCPRNYLAMQLQFITFVQFFPQMRDTFLKKNNII